MEDTIPTKICGRCNTAKPFSEFNKSIRGRLGLHNHCRQCQIDVRHKWYLEHRDYEIEKNKSPEIKEKAKKSRYEKYHNNHQWKEKFLEKNRVRRQQEPAKIKARAQRKRWYSIPKNRIACCLRGRLRKALKFNQKVDITEQLLGCSFEQAKEHLEKSFQCGMTWENYGQWHIDHIVPCSKFDLALPQHQKMCFNYRNLQPMWSKENISKNNKVSIDVLEQTLRELRSL